LADWAARSPFEKVIETNDDLSFLLENDSLVRPVLCILESADRIGQDFCGESVRTSFNVDCLAQSIANCDSMLNCAVGFERSNRIELHIF